MPKCQGPLATVFAGKRPHRRKFVCPKCDKAPDPDKGKSGLDYGQRFEAADFKGRLSGRPPVSIENLAGDFRPPERSPFPCCMTSVMNSVMSVDQARMAFLALSLAKIATQQHKLSLEIETICRMRRELGRFGPKDGGWVRSPVRPREPNPQNDLSG